MAFLGIADPAGARRREHGQRPALTTYTSNKFTLAFQKRKAASYRHVKNKVDTCREGEAMLAVLCRKACGWNPIQSLLPNRGFSVRSPVVHTPGLEWAGVWV